MREREEAIAAVFMNSWRCSAYGILKDIFSWLPKLFVSSDVHYITPLFILLHTNDFHNHLQAAQADYLRRLRQTIGRQGLLVDAGDAVASGNVTFRPGGETVLKTMNSVGYDAMTVGNREFHVARTGFHCKVGLAQFPVLCANVRSSGICKSGPEVLYGEGGPSEISTDGSVLDSADTCDYSSGAKPGAKVDPPVCSHIVRTLHSPDGNSLRLVVFGLTVPMVTERMFARHLSAYLFDDPLVAAAKLVPKLKARYQPDLVVALTHIGNIQDQKLAATVPGIDVIIGGHSHTRLPEGERVGDTLIVQTGCYAHHIGRVDIAPAVMSGSAQTRLNLTASLLDFPKAPTEMEIEAQIQRLQVGLREELESSLAGRASETAVLPS